MSKVIKSGMFIEGIEVTSAHVGMKVEVVRTGTRYLPVGYETEVEEVFSSYYDVLDNTQDRYPILACSHGADDYITFKWVTPPKPLPKTSPTQRKKLAKVVRDAEEQMEAAIKACEDVGMVVSCPSEISISYQSPVEEFSMTRLTGLVSQEHLEKLGITYEDLAKAYFTGGGANGGTGLWSKVGGLLDENQHKYHQNVDHLPPESRLNYAEHKVEWEDYLLTIEEVPSKSQALINELKDTINKAQEQIELLTTVGEK